MFNLFLGGLSGASLVQQYRQFFSGPPSQIFTMLGTSLPAASNFFLSFTIYRAFVSVFLRMLIPHGGTWQYAIR